MSNYIYHSDLPETPPHVPEVSADEKKKEKPCRGMRILCICLFIIIAGLVFFAVIFLSGSLFSTDENNESGDTNAAWRASASCSEITRIDPID